MRRIAFVLLPLVAQPLVAADSSRPRGVGPEFAKYYKDASTFTCISNPSIEIPISQINDDFCDCPDGSDEPGTSACAHLSQLSPSTLGDRISSSKEVNTTLALPGYYCKNKGHRPSYIPFTYLNDGVCDHEFCCDGSDEWARVGGIKCDDRCKEIGNEWRKNDEQRQRSMGLASKRRQELAVEASTLRQQVSDRIQTLETEIQGAEIKFKGLEKELQEVERQEKGKIVKKPKEGGKLGTLVQLAKDRMNELREALSEVRGQRDTARDRVSELENILRTFKEEYNPNFNDEGVKRAVRAWEDYAARDQSDLGNEARDRDLDEICKSEEEGGTIQWAEFEEPEDAEGDILYQFEAYLPPSLREWVDKKLRDLRLFLIENGVLAGAHDPNAESPALEAARSALKEAENDLSNGQRQLTEHKEDLENDYGRDDIFRALKGRCVEKDSGEYTYELCWLGTTRQNSKKGHMSTLMGNFVGSDVTEVDDELPPDGKGLGSGKRVVLKYENGQHCWNGPARSTMVVLGCSETEELWKVTEEEKCVYRMEAGTSAVCGANSSAEKKTKDETVKDEL